MTGSRWPSEDTELRGMLNVARSSTLVLFLLACFFVLFFCLVLNVAWSSSEPPSTALHSTPLCKAACVSLLSVGKDPVGNPWEQLRWPAVQGFKLSRLP